MGLIGLSGSATPDACKKLANFLNKRAQRQPDMLAIPITASGRLRDDPFRHPKRTRPASQRLVLGCVEFTSVQEQHVLFSGLERREAALRDHDAAPVDRGRAAEPMHVQSRALTNGAA